MKELSEHDKEIVSMPRYVFEMLTKKEEHSNCYEPEIEKKPEPEKESELDILINDWYVSREDLIETNKKNLKQLVKDLFIKMIDETYKDVISIEQTRLFRQYLKQAVEKL